MTPTGGRTVLGEKFSTTGGTMNATKPAGSVSFNNLLNYLDANMEDVAIALEADVDTVNHTLGRMKLVCYKQDFQDEKNPKASNGRLTAGGYYVPENHVIVHVRGGIVRETDEPTGIVVEVWNHDECAADKGTRDNCPSCRRSLKP